MDFFWVPPSFKNIAASAVDRFFTDAIFPTICGMDPELIWGQRHLRGEPHLLQPLHNEMVARHYPSIIVRLRDPLQDL